MEEIKLEIKDILNSELKVSIAHKKTTLHKLKIDNTTIYTESNINIKDQNLIIKQWESIPKILRSSVKNIYIGLEPLLHLKGSFAHSLIKKEFRKNNIYIPADTAGELNLTNLLKKSKKKQIK